MADLGDIGNVRAHALTYNRWLIPAIDRIHSLSDAARAAITPKTESFGYTNARGKIGLNVVADVSDAPAGENIALFKKGQIAYPMVRADGSGAKFYDLDDGVYYAASTSSAAAWRITVTGATVDVETLVAPVASGSTPSTIQFS
ncbi:MAG TPA: hypothetical protein VGK41_01180 [Solirubrobacterales bacterium]